MQSIKKSNLYALIALLLLVIGFTFPSIAFYKVPQKIQAGQIDAIPSYVYPLWNLYQTGRYVSPYTPKGAERDLAKMIERKGEIGMMSLRFGTLPWKRRTILRPHFQKEFPCGSM